MISRLPNLVQSERDNTYTDTKFPRMPVDGIQKWCAMYNGCSDAQHLGWRAGWWRCWGRSPACWRGRCRGPGSPCSYPPQRTGPHTHPAHQLCSPSFNPVSQIFWPGWRIAAAHTSHFPQPTILCRSCRHAASTLCSDGTLSHNSIFNNIQTIQ